jgi:hypothetical protein
MALRPKVAGSEVRGPDPSRDLVSASRRLPVGRCKLHGGASTGPQTKDGLARLTEAKIKHGRFTKEKRAAARLFAEQGRQMRGELKELETWFVDHGHLSKNWRKDWDKL